MNNRPERLKYYHGNIKLDIDHRSLFRWQKETLQAISEYLGLYLINAQKTKHGWHYQYWVNTPITQPEAILIQILLGSDRKRELMNYLRFLNGAKLEDWNILFDKKFEED